MNGFKRICACFLGMILLVAGILKLMDPVGSGLVMDEYLKFFHLGFLAGISRVLACGLALFEGLAGAALIAGVWRRITAVASGVMMIFFTLITIILYIAHPAMDCGCFGEAVHLNHAQTLLKNLILDAVWCLAFIPMRNLGQPQRIKYVSFSLAAVSLVFFLLFSSLSVPLRDYTDFKPGTELEEQPLFFYDANYEYADSLSLAGKVMAVSSYDPGRLSARDMTRIEDFAKFADEGGYTVLFITCSTPEDIAEMGLNPALLAGTFFSDRKQLLTLNRSNGGVTYIDDGQIIRKWANQRLPGQDDLSSIQKTAPADYMLTHQNRTRAIFQGFLLYVFAVLLLL